MLNPLDIVRHSDSFAGLPDSDAGAVAGLGRPRRFAPGEVLFRQEEPSDAFYLIGSGEVEVGVQVGEQWLHCYTLRPGDAAGIVSFFGRTQHRTTARAEGPAETLAFGREALARLREMPTVLISIFETRTQRMQKLVELQENLKGLSRPEIEKRADSLRRLIEDLEDQSTALYNEIHRAHIRLNLCESRLASLAGEGQAR